MGEYGRVVGQFRQVLPGSSFGSEWLLFTGLVFGAIDLLFRIVNLPVRKVRPSWPATYRSSMDARPQCRAML
jgi:hypothetical protein